MRRAHRGQFHVRGLRGPTGPSERSRCERVSVLRRRCAGSEGGASGARVRRRRVASACRIPLGTGRLRTTNAESSRLRREQGPERACSAFHAVYNFQPVKQLDRVLCPVLALSNRHDPVFPVTVDWSGIRRAPNKCDRARIDSRCTGHGRPRSPSISGRSPPSSCRTELTLVGDIPPLGIIEQRVQLRTRHLVTADAHWRASIHRRRPRHRSSAGTTAVFSVRRIVIAMFAGCLPHHAHRQRSSGRERALPPTASDLRSAVGGSSRFTVRRAQSGPLEVADSRTDVRGINAIADSHHGRTDRHGPTMVCRFLRYSTLVQQGNERSGGGVSGREISRARQPAPARESSAPHHWPGPRSTVRPRAGPATVD